MARVYADINERMPRSYWDYDSVNISWGVLENYEVVRKIGMSSLFIIFRFWPFLSILFGNEEMWKEIPVGDWKLMA